MKWPLRTKEMPMNPRAGLSWKFAHSVSIDELICLHVSIMSCKLSWLLFITCLIENTFSRFDKIATMVSNSSLSKS